MTLPNLRAYQESHTPLEAIGAHAVVLDDGTWRCVLCLSVVDGGKVWPDERVPDEGSLDCDIYLVTGYECLCCGAETRIPR